MAAREGLEPSTYGLTVRRSTDWTNEPKGVPLFTGRQVQCAWIIWKIIYDEPRKSHHSGGPNRARSYDLSVISGVLYQLSYRTKWPLYL